MGVLNCIRVACISIVKHPQRAWRNRVVRPNSAPRIYNATPSEIAAMQRFNFQKAVECAAVNTSNFVHAIQFWRLKAVRISGGQ